MVAVGTGSRDEPAELQGISHLLEHSVFRATSKADSFQMAKEIEGAGGELNAFTGREETAFYGITIKETADIAASMVADIVTDPKLSDKDIELERKIVLQELSMIRDDPETYIHDLYHKNLWRGHPLSQDEGGPMEIVENITPDQIREYYADRYGIPNLSVFAFGTSDVEKTIEWASERFDGMTGKKVIKRTKPPMPEAGYFFEQTKTDHCQVAMGFPGLPADDMDRIALKMVTAILGSGTSSRLFQKVREEKALVYSVYATQEYNTDSSAAVTYMSCTDSNVIETMSAVAKVITKLNREGLEPGELNRTKNLMKGSMIRSMESSEQRLYSMGRWYLLNSGYLTLSDRLRLLDEITEDDVMRAANKIFHADRLNVTVLGKGNKEIRDFDLSSILP